MAQRKDLPGKCDRLHASVERHGEMAACGGAAEGVKWVTTWPLCNIEPLQTHTAHFIGQRGWC